MGGCFLVKVWSEGGRVKENTELIRLCISNKVSATGVGALGRGKERSNEKCVRSVILNEQ